MRTFLFLPKICGVFLTNMLVMFLSLGISKAQTDTIGSGRAMHLNGSNQYISFGNPFTGLKPPISISAWIRLDPTTNFPAPVFISASNGVVYNGFWFFAWQHALFMEYGDGQGGNSPSFRKGKIAILDNPDMVGRWIHVCGVMNSSTDIQLYLNGVDVGGELSGFSALPMNSDTPGDTARIGYNLSNGVPYWLNGSIDEVRLWNRALSATEVRNTMCTKLSGEEPGLIGYWTFDELSGNSVQDHSGKGNDGILKNAPTREYSGAAIGDKSIYTYSSITASTRISMHDGTDSIVVKDIAGSPEGVQIYEVLAAPSQTNGLDMTKSNDPYFGVFLCSSDANNTFKVLGCNMYDRVDNSVNLWNADTGKSSFLQRAEVIRPVLDSLFNLSLPPDTVVCDQTSWLIKSGLGNSGFDFFWNTGATTPDISVNHTGYYKLTVAHGCSLGTDSVFMKFLTTPASFSLGVDQLSCTNPDVLLNIPNNNPDVTRLWQDGSSQSTYHVVDFGLYWLTVSNKCGTAMDSIEFKRLNAPSSFSLGPDQISCKSPDVALNIPTSKVGITWIWQDGSNDPDLHVKNFGLYWLKGSNDCGVAVDSIEFKQIKYSIDKIPDVFTPNGDQWNPAFEIQRNFADELSVVIVDRWGLEVMRSADYRNDWTAEGLSGGVYFVLIKGECLDEQKGLLTILK